MKKKWTCYKRLLLGVVVVMRWWCGDPVVVVVMADTFVCESQTASSSATAGDG